MSGKGGQAMRYGSVCSGIEAATVAWHPLGWTPAWFSEIDAFPCALLAHHYPSVPNIGDMTAIRGRTDLERIDLLVGGTPCQSFSVAGLRKGLDDPRGNLALVFLGIADALRPRWVVWENVPGVLSSGGGRDFGAFLGGLAELGYGFAYRVLDAEYVRVESHPRAVPQRRRRVFVVGHHGADWRRAAAVLFERESLCGHPPPSRGKGEGVAGSLAPGAHPGGFNGQDAYSGQLVAHSLRAEGHDASEDGTGRGTPLVLSGSGKRTLHARETDVAFGEKSQTATNLIAFQSNGNTGDMMAAGLEVSPTVRRGSATGGNPPAMASLNGVRRLTPRECERLQGFPDNYTAIPYRGKPAADAPRYKALGNSFAVNVVRWIGERIQLMEDISNARLV